MLSQAACILCVFAVNSLCHLHYCGGCQYYEAVVESIARLPTGINLCMSDFRCKQCNTGAAGMTARSFASRESIQKAQQSSKAVAVKRVFIIAIE